MEADKDLGSRQSCTSAVTDWVDPCGSIPFGVTSASIDFYGKLEIGISDICIANCEVSKFTKPAEIIGVIGQEEPIVLSSQSTACPTVSEKERPRPFLQSPSQSKHTVQKHTKTRFLPAATATSTTGLPLLNLASGKCLRCFALFLSSQSSALSSKPGKPCCSKLIDAVVWVF